MKTTTSIPPTLTHARLASNLLMGGCLRVAPVVGVPELLRSRGLDPQRVLSEAGIDTGLLADPDNIISFVALGRMLHHCRQATGCPHFGLLVGGQGGVATLGLVGLLGRYAPDVGTALRDMILHLHLHDRGAVPALTTDDGTAILSYLVYQPGVESTDQIYDAAAAIMFNILRELCGGAWSPTEVLFSHGKPQDIRPYRRFFRSPLRFEAEQTAVVFPSSLLERPLGGSNSLLRQLLEEEIDRLEGESSEKLTDRLRCVLRGQLITGKGSMDEIAETFKIHRRTLTRRLEAEGTSFRQVVDEVRFEIVQQLLRDTHMPLADIAELLDYSDSTSLTRAFRRWSGTTPSAWRHSSVNGSVSKD